MADPVDGTAKEPAGEDSEMPQTDDAKAEEVAATAEETASETAAVNEAAKELAAEAIAAAEQPGTPPEAPPAPAEGQPLLSPKHYPTLFGNVLENNVTFCIDTSGSMYNCLDAVKEQLIEALLQKAHQEQPSMFNVIEFNTDVTQWADKLVRCTPQTVAVAAAWVNKLEAKTGTNTLDALLTALADQDCESVYLVTDGLPDQEPTDILDHAGFAAQGRPVHCYYIQGETADSEATTFLQDLAAETYGSFHVISVTQHGAIERVTPIYHAEAAPRPYIHRSTEGGIYTNEKFCSVGATVDSVPEVEVVEPPVIIGAPWGGVVTASGPVHYYSPYYPFSYYRPWLPYYGWSRFRPARRFSKFASDYVDEAGRMTLAPGAGSLLINQKVLARRHADGFFYEGMVKSQILEDKFLVALGPCKHGKFKDTVYQETFVYDIISHTDAMRHTILTGDKVLAPVSPDGEKYAPGIVIDGQEKRTTEGSSEDRELTVTFYDGHSEQITKDRAMWIPEALHDRITFELKLPAKVRQDMSTQGSYPIENKPGYPTSGPVAHPPKYDKFEKIEVEHPDSSYETGLYKTPYYIPLYPTFYKHHPRPSAVRSEDVDQLIPGTDITKSELNDKVLSQIMEHKMKLGGSLKDESQNSSRLLQRREQVPEKTLLKDTRKSVTFQDLSDVEAEVDQEDLEARDSGHGSGTDLIYDSDLDLDMELLDDQSETRTRDVAVGPERRMRRRRRSRSRSKSPTRRPPWRYWGNDPAPDIIDPPSHDPFDEPRQPVPLETREQLRTQFGVQWTSPFTEVVDPYARYLKKYSVRDSLHLPKPPDYKPEKQSPGRDISDVLGTPLPHAERVAEGRRDFRRRMMSKRQKAWDEKMAEQIKQERERDDQQRSRIADRLSTQRQKMEDEFEKSQQAVAAKRQTQEQLRHRLQQYCDRDANRDDDRLNAMRARREYREAMALEREREDLERNASRQAYREGRARSLWDRHHEQLQQEAQDEMYRENRARQAKVNRREHFRQIEQEAQRRKNLRSQVKDQNMGILRSQIFP